MQLPSDPVPVVVLKFDPNIFHHGALGIVRSLGRLGVPVYAVQEDRWAPVGGSRYLEGKLPWMDPVATKDNVRDLMNLARALRQRAILIPTDDIASVFVAEHANELEQYYLFPRQHASLVRSLCSKEQLYHLCKRFGVPAPQTWFPASRGEVLNLLDDAVFPLVIKAIDPWLLRGLKRRASVVIADGADELLSLYDEMENPSQPNLMVQEYIPGGPQSVWMYNGYFNAHSESLVHFTGTKVRQHPPYTGMTTLGVCSTNEVVEATTKRFMKAIGYYGIVDMGYRYDARDGQYKLLDVNPRIGATFRLFVGANGMDVARALYLDLTRSPVQTSQARDGRKWLVENYDITSTVQYFRDGTVSPADWWRSFRDLEESAWFASDDPLPFVLMSLRFLARAPQKVLGPVVRRALARLRVGKG